MPRGALSTTVALALLGCGTKEAKKPAADSTHVAAATKVGELAGFDSPESVRYDSAADLFYVSNINGDPGAQDSNGYISALPADLSGTPRKLIQSGVDGVTLNAPKGLVLVGDTLWVADIDAVRGFDKVSGKLRANIDLRPMHAQFLNDIAVGPDGALYVTDTNADRIFKIAGRTATVALATSALAGPNGITWDAKNARFVVVSFKGKNVFAWTPGETTLTTLATGPGGFDGVEVLADGRILVTSWESKSVGVVVGGHLTPIVTDVDGPADIGIDTRRHRVALPRLTAGKIELWQLP